MVGYIIIALGNFRYKSEEDIKRDVKFLEKILFCHDVRYYSHEFILMSEILNFEDIEV
jgi:hypothetical protein